MLERTTNGLSNEHLFYDTDLVVYCEGREGEADTHDEMFWEKVLTSFGVRCTCKSGGSKTNIIPLAQRATNEGASNVAFAMDRDYCDHYGFPLVGDNILYTFGYSWENDVLIDVEIDRVFVLFAPIKKGEELRRDYEEFKLSVQEDCEAVNRIDIVYYPADQALFDREKP